MAAGLNAYVPLLAIGLLSRFTELVQLPGPWIWLEHPASLVVLAVLLAVEVVADKVPAVDSANDVLQTAIRPAAGGMVFAAGAGSQTVAVADPADIFAGGAWVPVLIGVLIALTTHTTKAVSRPLVNVSTAGAGAPVVSTAEDAGSAALVGVAVFAPVLVAVLLVILVVLALWVAGSVKRRRPGAGGPAAPGGQAERPGRWTP